MISRNRCIKVRRTDRPQAGCGVNAVNETPAMNIPASQAPTGRQTPMLLRHPFRVPSYMCLTAGVPSFQDSTPCLWSVNPTGFADGTIVDCHINIRAIVLI
ncbi:MAG: hypothetical protein IJ635_02595 [Bacteroidaceae bacterium]|nr:hypothetical protein [Bacteroidaceae bacterium]